MIDAVPYLKKYDDEETGLSYGTEDAHIAIDVNGQTWTHVTHATHSQHPQGARLFQLRDGWSPEMLDNPPPLTYP
jgi:hypothetical protein